MTQKEKIKLFMEENGSITPLDAMREFGIMRLAARISDLRKDGMKITSFRVRDKNRYGQAVTYAMYIKGE